MWLRWCFCCCCCCFWQFLRGFFRKDFTFVSALPVGWCGPSVNVSAVFGIHCCCCWFWREQFLSVDFPLVVALCLLPDGWFASLSFCRCSNRADESPATGHIAITAPLTAAAVVIVVVVVVVVFIVAQLYKLRLRLNSSSLLFAVSAYLRQSLFFK